jgi:hypothetical protein
VQKIVTKKVIPYVLTKIRITFVAIDNYMAIIWIQIVKNIV